MHGPSFSGVMLSSAILAFAALTSAQILIPTAPSASFPACGLSCSLILQAQGSCTPPEAPVSSQAIYVSCFCQSTLLAPFYTTPDGVCDAYCPVESDRQLLQSWYRGFCASGGTNNNGIGVTSGANAGTTLSTITSGVTTVVVVENTSGAPSNTGLSTSSSGTSSTGHQDWIDTHWRWILMLGILLVGLVLLALLAVCLKRRHRRKLEGQRASASGFPVTRNNRVSTASLGVDMWGPHQHMAHTRGWEYSHDQDGSAAADGALDSGGKRGSRKIKRERSERSRHREHRTSTREVDENAPDLAGRTKSQRRRDRERDREKSRDIEKKLRSVKEKDGQGERDVERDRALEKETEKL